MLADFVFARFELFILRTWVTHKCSRYSWATSAKLPYTFDEDCVRLDVDEGPRVDTTHVRQNSRPGGESEYVAMRCFRCGYEHALYGLHYSAGTLERHITDRRAQMLKIGGGAWSFASPLIDCHPEIKRLVVEDETGAVWRVDRETFDRYARRGDLGRGEQVWLFLKYWERETASSSSDNSAGDSRAKRPAQLPLFTLPRAA